MRLYGLLGQRMVARRPSAGHETGHTTKYSCYLTTAVFGQKHISGKTCLTVWYTRASKTCQVKLEKTCSCESTFSLISVTDCSPEEATQQACQNGGQCKKNDFDQDGIFNHYCVCPEGYSGTKCETQE